MSKRRNHQSNFRQKLKNLLKDYQRGKVTNMDIDQWFMDRGIWPLQSRRKFLSIVYILNSAVPSRILSRLGKAALKKNSFVKLHDLVNPLCPYHQIKFLSKLSISEYYNKLSPTEKYVHEVKSWGTLRMIQEMQIAYQEKLEQQQYLSQEDIDKQVIAFNQRYLQMYQSLYQLNSRLNQSHEEKENS